MQGPINLLAGQLIYKWDWSGYFVKRELSELALDYARNKTLRQVSFGNDVIADF
jgi:hypothetical protein